MDTPTRPRLEHASLRLTPAQVLWLQQHRERTGESANSTLRRALNELIHREQLWEDEAA